MTREEFKVLFDGNFDRIRNYIYYRSSDKESATDIAQEVFLKLWEKNVAYNPKLNVGLLYKMAIDAFISKYRHQKVEENYRSNLNFSLNDSDILPDEAMELDEIKIEYEKALSEMTDKQRAVFLMSRLEGLKYSEISEKLDISIKAVEKRMKHALSLLKVRLNYQG